MLTQPRGVSRESLAQANGVQLWVGIQVTGIGQGTVISPEDWKAPPLVMIRGLFVDPVTDQMAG